MKIESLRCEHCGRDVTYDEARRAETVGDLDPLRWQTFCRPDCGRRLGTVFVGRE